MVFFYFGKKLEITSKSSWPYVAQISSLNL
jgi:hypothetical protein